MGKLKDWHYCARVDFEGQVPNKDYCKLCWCQIHTGINTIKRTKRLRDVGFKKKKKKKTCRREGRPHCSIPVLEESIQAGRELTFYVKQSDMEVCMKERCGIEFCHVEKMDPLTFIIVCWTLMETKPHVNTVSLPTVRVLFITGEHA